MNNHRIYLYLILLSALFIVPSQATENYGKINDPLVAEVLGTQIRTENPQELLSIVSQALYQDYARQNNIQASQQDIDLYLGKIEAMMRQAREKNAARRDELMQRLDSGTLNNEQTGTLKAELSALEAAHAQALKEEKMTGQERAEMRLVQTSMVTALIEQWKTNKAFYQQYGGRVIAQQFGPEPLDAVHEYFRAQQQKGAFKILDPQMEAAFWAYFTSDTGHRFYTPDSEQARQAFDQAPWMR